VLDAFCEWLATVLLAREYVQSRGMWIDHPSVYAANICSVRHTGGAPPIADDRRQRFQVLLLGPREDRAAGALVLADANALVYAAIQGILPCGATNVRASTEPVGPGYTVEGRAWAQVDFDVLF
jgi:hypothetical protein